MRGDGQSTGQRRRRGWSSSSSTGSTGSTTSSTTRQNILTSADPGRRRRRHRCGWPFDRGGTPVEAGDIGTLKGQLDVHAVQEAFDKRLALTQPNERRCRPPPG